MMNIKTMPFLDDYETVEDRLRSFWSDHPLGRIETELVDHTDDSYIVKASVWVTRDRKNPDPPDATGLAQEAMTPQHRVNSTWPLENCETAAIGRALANLGYAPKGKRPSREEMSKPSPAGPIVATRAAESPAGDTSSATPGEVVADSAPPEEGEKTPPGRGTG